MKYLPFALLTAVVIGLAVGPLLGGCSARVGTERDPIISGHVLDR
jgi:hypothetical protein